MGTARLRRGDPLTGWTDLQNATAEYVLDWFYITIRFTVLANTMTGLHNKAADDDDDDEPVPRWRSSRSCDAR